MRNKPGIVVVGMAVQTGISVLLISAAAFLLFLIYTVRNSAGASQGFKLSLITILPLAITALAASWGMWKRRAWGWWTGLLVNFLALLTMIPDLIQRNPAPDWDDVAVAAMFGLAAALFLPGRVRQYFLRGTEMQQEIGLKET